MIEFFEFRVIRIKPWLGGWIWFERFKHIILSFLLALKQRQNFKSRFNKARFSFLSPQPPSPVFSLSFSTAALYGTAPSSRVSSFLRCMCTCCTSSSPASVTHNSTVCGRIFFPSSKLSTILTRTVPSRPCVAHWHHVQKKKKRRDKILICNQKKKKKKRTSVFSRFKHSRQIVVLKRVSENTSKARFASAVSEAEFKWEISEVKQYWAIID